MIYRKAWEKVERRDRGMRRVKSFYEGVFLFWFIPVYVIRTKTVEL